MEIIFNESKAQLPKVVLDKENNKFEISGQSIPEDVISFYTPILEWLDKYSESPNENTQVALKMVYYNTASSKMIFEIIKRLDDMYINNHASRVLWYYAEDDEDMEEAGKKFEEMFTVPFEFIGYDPD
ncbi:DUF1987 domain-containing protein [Bacteroidota bacterium]